MFVDNTMASGGHCRAKTASPSLMQSSWSIGAFGLRRILCRAARRLFISGFAGKVWQACSSLWVEIGGELRAQAAISEGTLQGIVIDQAVGSLGRRHRGVAGQRVDLLEGHFPLIPPSLENFSFQPHSHFLGH